MQSGKNKIYGIGGMGGYVPITTGTSQGGRTRKHYHDSVNLCETRPVQTQEVVNSRLQGWSSGSRASRPTEARGQRE